MRQGRAGTRATRGSRIPFRSLWLAHDRGPSHTVSRVLTAGSRVTTEDSSVADQKYQISQAYPCDGFNCSNGWWSSGSRHATRCCRTPLACVTCHYLVVNFELPKGSPQTCKSKRRVWLQSSSSQLACFMAQTRCCRHPVRLHHHAWHASQQTLCCDSRPATPAPLQRTIMHATRQRNILQTRRTVWCSPAFEPGEARWV